MVLDEYSYLINRIDGINSIIQQKIDKYNKSNNMKFIASGSSIDIMQNLVDYSNPLYGRLEKAIKLEEQNYLDSQLFYPTFSNEDKVKFYSIFGGEPSLNQRIGVKLSFKENMIKLALQEESPLEFMVNSSILNEVNKVSSANDVLLAIAMGKHKNKEIADACQTSSAKIDYVLNKLIILGIIEKIVPIKDLKNKRKTFYYIKSNFINFYYRYIYKNLSYKNSMTIESFNENYIERDFISQYVPKIYEKISKEFLILCSKNNLIKPFKLIGTYWYGDPQNKVNGQFDVVTLDDTGYIFYEVKFIDKKVDETILNEEIEQLSKA